MLDHNKCQGSSVQFSAKHLVSIVDCSGLTGTAQYSRVQYCTVDYSTVQYRKSEGVVLIAAAGELQYRIPLLLRAAQRAQSERAVEHTVHVL